MKKVGEDKLTDAFVKVVEDLKVCALPAPEADVGGAFKPDPASYS